MNDAKPGVKPVKANRSTGEWIAFILTFIPIVCMIAAGLGVWAVGIFTRGYDYDEVLRAHSIWLTTQGQRPYIDFFEVHPPYFGLLGPIFKYAVDPVSALRALRLFASLGNLFFLAGLLVIARTGVGAFGDRAWAWVGVLFLGFNLYMVDFLLEFRVDGWAYAVIVWSTVWMRSRPLGPPRMFGFGLPTAFVSALLCPKIVFLPPLIAFFELIIHYRSRRDFVRDGSAYALSCFAAAVLFAGYLLINGIGLERTTLLLGRYHAISNANAGFRNGLLTNILMLWPITALIFAGAFCWFVFSILKKRINSGYDPALIIWMVLQVMIVGYPYKQYYAPWFLFGASFIPYLGLAISRVLKPSVILAAFLVCLFTMLSSYNMGNFWYKSNSVGSQQYLIRWMNDITEPNDRVIGGHPYHPIDRFDTFFLSFNTTDPKGFDSEKIFEQLPGLRELATPSRYREELEANPPAIIVLSSPYFQVMHTIGQWKEIDKFMVQKGYLQTNKGGVLFAIRPDRFGQAKQRGFIQ